MCVLLYEDDQNTVWIGTSNGIYKVRLHDKGIADHYTVENNLVTMYLER